MATTRPVTELDFDYIKADLINYIKTNPTFTDYAFEGSALNAIIDVLSYNTHNNAYYANMLHNESFLDTAQKRSSVVSRGKELGYIPRSTVGSTAYLDIFFTGGTTDFAETLSRGTSFSSTNDIGAYTFLVAEDYQSDDSVSPRSFKNVKIINGVQAQNYFVVDTTTNLRSIFTLPNQLIDTSTLKVFVRDSIGSVNRTEYFLGSNVYGLTSASKVYFLQESHDGHFEIYFGSDVVGKQPINGNVIDVDYFSSTQQELADNCRLFAIGSALGTASTINIVTTQVSFGGSIKEDIDSIKYNAVKANSAKERSVTPNDYELMVKSKFNFVKSVSVWGGEDNIPAVYGKVFLSIQPVSGYVISDRVKHDIITPAIRATSPMTIGLEFVDPTYLNLSFETKIKFNPYKTTINKFGAENLVRNAIVSYVNSIKTFNKDYIESVLSNIISTVDSGVVSVDLTKRLGFTLSPILGIESNFIKNLGNQIVPGTIASTKFNIFYDQLLTVTIKEIPGMLSIAFDPDGSVNTKQELGLFDSNGILVKSIGSVNLNTGKFNFTFSTFSYLTDSRFISISSELVNRDISTYRNDILNLTVDKEDSEIGLYNNNIVLAEIYVK